ncbi:ribonuclease E activity regulator RraA [Pseudarthrobacter phenanthrenivorans]|uniref:4-hydroxy-4-methyl-2-oxoglutarate aldolase n=1 Tax=Pseudarthrobacter phenanthrenivorans (strain DSM 18606 / JCM 16027 / LMG 23796 / Sphe3) TaxID=930171 RepID=F0M8J3_PSEPM|nr:ribonuclease E activity regulator RraA [Pseudarthrobacter phenanthrenivorans]ADX74911.1 RraA family protein [Pseudarthrobacter phenanthrenivorans Sphe3]TPV49706.1 ribonuclease E activity regulator RraA [Pseudarthrobacter phenanthrenivorans]
MSAAPTPSTAAVNTADLYDERGEELASVSLQFQSLGGRSHFSGRARTIRCFQDNALVKSTLATPGNGCVLVVDGGGSLGTALMGDMIAESAVANGWAGVVINGAIRDREAIAALDLGVKALGSNPRKSARDGAGEVDVDVVIDGVTIRTGAMIWCDPDGILVER